MRTVLLMVATLALSVSSARGQGCYGGQYSGTSAYEIPIRLRLHMETYQPMPQVQVAPSPMFIPGCVGGQCGVGVQSFYGGGLPSGYAGGFSVGGFPGSYVGGFSGGYGFEGGVISGRFMDRGGNQFSAGGCRSLIIRRGLMGNVRSVRCQ